MTAKERAEMKNVKLPKALHQKVKANAKAHGMNIESWTARAVSEFLYRSRFKIN
jgi:hypothetical protein